MAKRVVPQVGGGVETLPPAGDERREVLRARDDALAAAAEARGDDLGVVDPRKLEVDPEIAQHFNAFNELEVSNADPGSRYKWENAGYNGRFIKASRVLGWEVVQGSDPEAQEHVGIAGDTTRRVGDTILMRCRLDRYLLIERQRRARQAAHEGAVDASLREKAEQAGVRLHTPESLAHPTDKTAANISRVMNQAHAQQIAAQQFDARLRTGRVPGLSVGSA